jgi:hypothetical protein
VANLPLVIVPVGGVYLREYELVQDDASGSTGSVRLRAIGFYLMLAGNRFSSVSPQSLLHFSNYVIFYRKTKCGINKIWSI